MRNRAVRVSCVRPLPGRLHLRVPRRAEGRPRATAPATSGAGASAPGDGCSGASAAVRTTASCTHSSAPCDGCGVCGPCRCASPGDTSDAATALGLSPCGSSSVPGPCPTAHTTIATSRTPRIREPSRRGHGEPAEMRRAYNGIRKYDGTGPPCGRHLPVVPRGQHAWVGVGRRWCDLDSHRVDGIRISPCRSGEPVKTGRPAGGILALDLLHHGGSQGHE